MLWSEARLFFSRINFERAKHIPTAIFRDEVWNILQWCVLAHPIKVTIDYSQYSSKTNSVLFSWGFAAKYCIQYHLNIFGKHSAARQWKMCDSPEVLGMVTMSQVLCLYREASATKYCLSNWQSLSFCKPARQGIQVLWTGRVAEVTLSFDSCLFCLMTWFGVFFKISFPDVPVAAKLHRVQPGCLLLPCRSSVKV